jgi:hypothetical protein
MMIPSEFDRRPIRSSVMPPLTSAGKRAAFQTRPPRSGNGHTEIFDTYCRPEHLACFVSYSSLDYFHSYFGGVIDSALRLSLCKDHVTLHSIPTTGPSLDHDPSNLVIIPP